VIVLRKGCADNDLGLPALRHVDLTVREGEIVGIAGVAGNGQRELAELLTGCRALTEGTIAVGDEDLSGASPQRFLRAGVGSVPEDRLDTGLAKTETIWRNAILKTYKAPPIAGRAGVLRRSSAYEYAEGLCEAVGLGDKSVSAPAGSLSGGQAQRLLVGREMRIGARALVLAYPTRGLDVRAVETLHAEILEARSNGLAILLISEDLDELTVLSDRTLVLYEGEIVGEFEHFDRDAIGSLMGGMRPGGKVQA
jgi:ABC-type uncharacterized transport system ATPase subunit